MVNTLTSNNIDLETFLKTAGQSFSDAQKSIVPDLDFPASMILNNADLELKVTVSSDSRGKMSISPISSDDIIRGGIDPGLLSTLRISFVSSIGEIKLGATAALSPFSTGNIVPQLCNMPVDKAIGVLKYSAWQYVLHAAKSEDIPVPGTGSFGRVVKQNPAPGQPGDKQNTVIHIWANLSNAPVKDIDGIGSRYQDRLRKISISTVGELSLASAAQVSNILRTSEARAQNFIDMASLMSRLAILGFKDEVVELIISSGQIRSIEQLSSADPAKLYQACREAVTSGSILVPKGFKFTSSDVAGWIKAAGDYIQT
jgi:hypothetical protein